MLDELLRAVLKCLPNTPGAHLPSTHSTHPLLRRMAHPNLPVFTSRKNYNK